MQGCRRPATAAPQAVRHASWLPRCLSLEPSRSSEPHRGHVRVGVERASEVRAPRARASGIGLQASSLLIKCEKKLINIFCILQIDIALAVWTVVLHAALHFFMFFYGTLFAALTDAASRSLADANACTGRGLAHQNMPRLCSGLEAAPLARWSSFYKSARCSRRRPTAAVAAAQQGDARQKHADLLSEATEPAPSSNKSEWPKPARDPCV